MKLIKNANGEENGWTKTARDWMGRERDSVQFGGDENTPARKGFDAITTRARQVETELSKLKDTLIAESGDSAKYQSIFNMLEYYIQELFASIQEQHLSSPKRYQ
jgi:hypothetical protein|tara:strand:+ start:4350 stop:4664 length:315 start_codon:yes stop_codon:yes gene_type:complete